MKNITKNAFLPLFIILFIFAAFSCAMETGVEEIAETEETVVAEKVAVSDDVEKIYVSSRMTFPRDSYGSGFNIKHAGLGLTGPSVNISVDVYPTGGYPTNACILRKEYSYGKGFSLRWERLGQLQFCVNAGGKWYILRPSNSATDFPPNRWYNIRAHYDSYRGTMKVYVNNVLYGVASGTYAGNGGSDLTLNNVWGGIQYDTADLVIGSSYPYDRKYTKFKGYIKNVSITN